MWNSGSDSDWGIDDEPQVSNGTIATSTSVSIRKKGTSDTTELTFSEWKLTTRSGRSTASLSQLTYWLAKLGIEGPRNLRGLNLRDSSDEIGHGSQFTVFRSTHTLDQSSVKEVFKRVRISKLALRKEKSLAMNSDYLVGLRQLELEVLSSGLLKHRNIVRLLGWGYDYPDRYTPVPVLIMESAMMSLTEFLEPARGTLPSTELRSWDVRHHLSLDIAAGIEVMHKHNIVHGDIKPDNVLIFMQDNPVVPFVAKLSDFGVCIDMGNPTREDRRFRA